MSLKKKFVATHLRARWINNNVYFCSQLNGMSNYFTKLQTWSSHARDKFSGCDVTVVITILCTDRSGQNKVISVKRTSRNIKLILDIVILSFFFSFFCSVYILLRHTANNLINYFYNRFTIKWGILKILYLIWNYEYVYTCKKRVQSITF